MTSIKAIITIVIIWIITITAWLFEMTSASDMDCFRLESAIMEHRSSKWFKKIRAYKAVKSLILLCNKSK
jgi:hypothetical protein